MAKTTKSFLALLRGGNLGGPLVILGFPARVILPLPLALRVICFPLKFGCAGWGVSGGGWGPPPPGCGRCRPPFAA
ncbi:hypothetical protein KCA24_34900, partial [Escherichia coli]|nr:hypothetical protein [Escherichia coli]